MPEPTSPLPRLKPEDFLRLIEKSRQGKLKIYLGHAAGVGKTFAMLEEAHRLKKAGVQGFLVGESLMREADVAAAVRRLLGTP